MEKALRELKKELYEIDLGLNPDSNPDSNPNLNPDPIKMYTHETTNKIFDTAKRIAEEKIKYCQEQVYYQQPMVRIKNLTENKIIDLKREIKNLGKKIDSLTERKKLFDGYISRDPKVIEMNNELASEVNAKIDKLNREKHTETLSESFVAELNRELRILEGDMKLYFLKKNKIIQTRGLIPVTEKARVALEEVIDKIDSLIVRKDEIENQLSDHKKKLDTYNEEVSKLVEVNKKITQKYREMFDPRTKKFIPLVENVNVEILVLTEKKNVMERRLKDLFEIKNLIESPMGIFILDQLEKLRYPKYSSRHPIY